MFDRLNSNSVPKNYFLKTIVLFRGDLRWWSIDFGMVELRLTSTPLSQRAGVVSVGIACLQTEGVHSQKGA